jgi:hypothetical protein
MYVVYKQILKKLKKLFTSVRESLKMVLKSDEKGLYWKRKASMGSCIAALYAG